MPVRTPKAEMPVVILAGGMGTRLREETERVPKPLVEIGEQPILWHIMKIFGAHDLKRFVVCLGYKSWLIKQFFLNYREQISDFTIRLSDSHEPHFHDRAADEDWEVTCAETGMLSGTGGRLLLVRDYVKTDTFMFTYGDGIGRIDLDALLDFHYEQGRVGTVTGVHPSSRYGEMRVEDGIVTEFNEKPTQPEGFVSGGFFVFQREFFDYLSGDPTEMLEADPLQKLARDGQLAVHPHDDFWLGMDTYRDFLHLNDLWRRGEAPWKVWG